MHWRGGELVSTVWRLHVPGSGRRAQHVGLPVTRRAVDACGERPRDVIPDKLSRLNAANAFLRVIADQPTRRFFRYEQHVARLEFDGGGRIWYVNEWPGARRAKVYVSAPQHHWNGWCHGGTLAAIVECLVNFVRKGEKVPAGIGSKHWGMPAAEIETMRREGRRLGVVGDETNRSEA